MCVKLSIVDFGATSSSILSLAVLFASIAPSVGVLSAPSVGVLSAPSVGVLGAPSVGVLGAPSVGVFTPLDLEPDWKDLGACNLELLAEALDSFATDSMAVDFFVSCLVSAHVCAFLFLK